MSLGVGTYQIFVADRSGALLGEITNIASLNFTMERDDFGSAQLTLNNPPPDQCALLQDVHTIRHEMVIARDGSVVWEGPITRIGWYSESIVIDAKDVSWYLTRKIFTYPSFNYERASRNAIEAVKDAFWYHYPQASDPFRIGEYFSAYRSLEPADLTDPNTAALIEPWSMTMYDFFQRFADNGGLDYVVRGRRIIVYPHRTMVHRAERLLPEHFVQQPAIVEYGAQLFTRVVTRQQDGGISIATPPPEDQVWTDFYGEDTNTGIVAYIDQLRSNQQDGDGGDENESVGRITELTLQNSYPSPIEVQVPANSTVSPDAPVEFLDLMPGTFLTVEAQVLCKTVSRIQIIDRLNVTWTLGQENVAITTQQAPTVFNVGEEDNYGVLP